MKNKVRLCIVIVMWFVIAPSISGSGFESNTMIERWDSTMNVDYSDIMVFSPSEKLEFGTGDQFGSISNYPFKNYTHSYFNIEILGDYSYWIKEDYNNVSNIITLYSYEGEHAIFEMNEYTNAESSFHVLFYEDIFGNNGTLFDVPFESTQNGIFFEEWNETLLYNTWIKISRNESLNEVSMYTINDYTWERIFNVSVNPLSTFSLNLFNSQGYGKCFSIDAPERHYPNQIYFDIESSHRWKPKEYMGDNATQCTMNFSIDFPDKITNYPLPIEENGCSIVQVAFRNPFNLSSEVYSFYFAKIFTEEPIYFYSGNGIDWIATGFENYVKIGYNIHSFQYIEISGFKTNQPPSIYDTLGKDESFKLSHEGFINQSIQINFDCYTNGILPPVSYEINYQHQQSISDYGWIEVYAENVIEEKSGIYTPDGYLTAQIRDGYTKKTIFNDYDGETDKSYIVVLYSLDDKIAHQEVVTIRIFYLEKNDDDKVEKWLEENWKWLPISASGLVLLGTVRIRKKRKPSIKKNTVDIKTFYAHIGEVPKGCNVKNGKLICPKKPKKD